MKKLGLIVNPIAGMGGSVGLKGTDGVLDEALKLGALPGSSGKVSRAVARLLLARGSFEMLACGGPMGEDVLAGLRLTDHMADSMGPGSFCPAARGIDYRIVYTPSDGPTSAADTIAAARAMTEAGADIIAFAGGDGTARDIFDAVGESLPVLGIPAGVKIHSPVYAKTPELAGELLGLFLQGQTTLTHEAEVLDIDEADYRNDIINTRLYGYLITPLDRRFMQGSKSPSPQSEKSQQMSIAASVAEVMSANKGTVFLVGPGSTTRSLMEYLDAENTLLGVDAVMAGRTIVKDLTEHGILKLIDGAPAKLVITPTGGQGYLLGRGNQQISPAVIRKLGRDNILVLSTPAKLAGLGGSPLLVDTGDPEADALLRGYYRVITGFHEIFMYPVE